MSKVSQGVKREGSPYWGRGAWGLPIEWHNIGVKPSAEEEVGIWSVELEEGGKRPAQASSCRVNLRRGAYQPEGGHSSLVGQQDRQGGGRPELPGSGGAWPENNSRPTSELVSHGHLSWRVGPWREQRGLHHRRG